MKMMRLGSGKGLLNVLDGMINESLMDDIPNSTFS